MKRINRLATRRRPRSDRERQERHGVEVPLHSLRPSHPIRQPPVERLEVVIAVKAVIRRVKLRHLQSPDDEQPYPYRTDDRPRVGDADRAEKDPHDRRPDHDRDLLILCMRWIRSTMCRDFRV